MVTVSKKVLLSLETSLQRLDELEQAITQGMADNYWLQRSPEAIITRLVVSNARSIFVQDEDLDAFLREMAVELVDSDIARILSDDIVPALKEIVDDLETLWTAIYTAPDQGVRLNHIIVRHMPDRLIAEVFANLLRMTADEERE